MVAESFLKLGQGTMVNCMCLGAAAAYVYARIIVIVLRHVSLQIQ